MTMKRNASTIAMAVASATIMAQAQASAEQSSENKTLDNWSYDTIYEQGGVRADNLMDAEVFGPEGEEIGSIENVLVTKDNRIGAIIAQVGGFWDIGDTHVLIPWEDVELTNEGVQIPVTEDNADDYGLYDNDWITKQDLTVTQQVNDDVAAGSRVWKLSELLDDYASIGQGVGYGYVDNVLFSRNGEIQAVLAEADENYGGSAYAYPFYGYSNGWSPSYTTYSLPYSAEEIGNLEPFNYDDYDGLWEK